MEKGISDKMKLDWVSKAKGFAVLGVIATHVVGRFSIGKLSCLAYAGMYCVQLFFVLSAFLTFRSLDKGSSEWTFKDYSKYVLHKIYRLFPALFVACIWYISVRCFEVRGVPGIHDAIWKKVFFALSFLNGFYPEFINPFGNWYLGNLFIFYLFAPFLKKCIDTPKKSVFLFALSMVLSFAFTKTMNHLGLYTRVGPLYFCFPRQFPLLAAGIVFYNFDKCKEMNVMKNSFCLLLLVSLIGIPVGHSWRLILENHVLFGLLLFLFVYLIFSVVSLKILSWLDVIGDYSYGIYLYHICLYPIVCGFVERLNLENQTFSFILCYAVLLLVSLGCAIVSAYCFERPFLRFVDNKLKSWV